MQSNALGLTTAENACCVETCLACWEALFLPSSRYIMARQQSSRLAWQHSGLRLLGIMCDLVQGSGLDSYAKQWRLFADCFNNVGAAASAILAAMFLHSHFRHKRV